MSLQKMPLSKAADKSGMSEKTARKYRKSGLSPNESKKAHEWRTRKDPLLISMYPSNISLKTIVFGNILEISDHDRLLEGRFIFNMQQPA